MCQPKYFHQKAKNVDREHKVNVVKLKTVYAGAETGKRLLAGGDIFNTQADSLWHSFQRALQSVGLSGGYGTALRTVASTSGRFKTVCADGAFGEIQRRMTETKLKRG